MLLENRIHPLNLFLSGFSTVILEIFFVPLFKGLFHRADVSFGFFDFYFLGMFNFLMFMLLYRSIYISFSKWKIDKNLYQFNLVFPFLLLYVAEYHTIHNISVEKTSSDIELTIGIIFVSLFFTGFISIVACMIYSLIINIFSSSSIEIPSEEDKEQETYKPSSFAIIRRDLFLSNEMEAINNKIEMVFTNCYTYADKETLFEINTFINRINQAIHFSEQLSEIALLMAEKKVLDMVFELEQHLDLIIEAKDEAILKNIDMLHHFFTMNK